MGRLDELTIKLRARTREFEGDMKRAQGVVQQNAERISKAGGVVAGLGSTFGSIPGPVGAAGSAVGQFAGLLGTMTMGSALVGGAALGIGLIAAKYREVSDAAKQAKQSAEAAADSMVESVERYQAALMGITLPDGTSLIQAASRKAGKARLEQQLGTSVAELMLGEAASLGEATRYAGPLGYQLEWGAKKGLEYFARKRKEAADEAERELSFVRAGVTARRKAAEKAEVDKKIQEGLTAALKLNEGLAKKYAKHRKSAAKAAKDEAEASWADPFKTGVRGGAEKAWEANLAEAKRQAEEEASWADPFKTGVRGGAEKAWEDNLVRYEELKRRQEELAEQRRLAHEEELAQIEEKRQAELALAQERASILASESLSAAQFAGQQLNQVVYLQAQIAGARKAGNAELVAELKQQEKGLAQEILASTLDYISQVAISHGSVLVLRGAGELAMGNPGGAGGIAAGGALVALGIGGMAGAAGLRGYAAGAASGAGDAAAYAGGVASAPSGPIGPGTAAAGDRKTIVYNVYGNAFGLNEDDSARAVGELNERYNELEGRRVA